MLIFLGGAARTGKGILERRLLTEQRLPYFSVDVLKMGLARGAPEYAIDPDAGAIAVAERIWPLVREMSHNLISEASPYLIEGEILPAQVAWLRDEYPARVLGCFLGYPTISVEQKLSDLRRYGGHANDWPHSLPDDALRAIIEREIAFSQYLQAECAAHRMAFFDTSDQFLATHDQVVGYIEAALREPLPPYARAE
jgi:hypothetical protein